MTLIIVIHKHDKFFHCRLTAEYETTKNALSAEIDQKREVLSGTSQQIDLYQKNFNGLKDELTRVSMP